MGISDEEHSLINRLASEIRKEIPSFSGEIKGYIGMIEMPISDNVLRQDGTIMPEGFGVVLTGLDGELILKKGDAEITKYFY